MRRLLCIALLVGGVPVLAVAQTTRAVYRVTFAATWSASTHPEAFPSNPHFSGLVGATHGPGVVFWNHGDLASDGIELMAETGGKSQLLAEVAASGSRANQPLSGGGISVSPGQVSLEFELTPEHPLLTLVSMLAPSPDWFVGVSGLALWDGASWPATASVILEVYDAGTDHGPSYSSANADADPAEPIAVLRTAPFASDSVVGSFEFERVSVTAVEPDPASPGLPRIAALYPMPASDWIRVQIESPRDPEPNADLRVVDVLGRTRWRAAPGSRSGEFELQVRDWPSGWYLLVMQSGGRTVKRSFVVN